MRAVGRADLFADMHYGEASDTWSAKPLACAAVLATLDEFESGTSWSTPNDFARARRRAGAASSRWTWWPTSAAKESCGASNARAVGQAIRRRSGQRLRRTCYLGDAAGRAIHLLGPLAGKVLRVSPPLVMPLDEAQEYLDAMYDIFAEVGQTVARARR